MNNIQIRGLIGTGLKKGQIIEIAKVVDSSHTEDSVMELVDSAKELIAAEEEVAKLNAKEVEDLKATIESLKSKPKGKIMAKEPDQTNNDKKYFANLSNVTTAMLQSPVELEVSEESSKAVMYIAVLPIHVNIMLGGVQTSVELRSHRKLTENSPQGSFDKNTDYTNEQVLLVAEMAKGNPVVED